ncbi:flagellar export protein FliJ [Ancylobacter sp. 6x-1]|uniref:Flagellar export protein FliJ n=1 Tax=Ancylobacter crimeensis TaxID=2579147 RepID=A0ABT0D9C3_9HYPH|nr:flagellar export protein FliJ [Ancylobacter crimeensis]MCK0196556.1 flagellar export protein FliJ [Ancylobacter crimeensis]
MKSRDTVVRLKRFQTEEKRRQFLQIETMIAEFERMAHDLDREIAVEHQRAGISDPTHFAYPTYARAAAGRRDNLRASADELKQQLDDARAAYEAALEELKKIETLGERAADTMDLAARASQRPRGRPALSA